ncbi:uncharacterized protein LOC119190069 [Manduca sexta]|uniref:Uncharacterized protein n=1 Tax=Manduca sexta TaxID=7130 RepID=A0A922CW87_MANSE|nr:uncharacterized protein LOC119190069 [Manduca sexta]KAG6460672.1 hypothetical protein O3G_MSEX012145 [Manduca sexta]
MFGCNLSCFGFLAAVCCVIAQEYYEELHKARYSTHVRQIPKSFEIRGGKALEQFNKNIKEIEQIANNENITLLYKVKIEKLKPFFSHKLKKILHKKGRSKKYNVPLKKNSMKLSNFEAFLRKTAEENGRNVQNIDYYPAVTTEKQKFPSTRQIIMKYKPIISRVRTNYTKIIRPVRNKEIILTV